ncbi:DUF397 domain-containing protein [Solihabitans fulvus]|uniref:DUF397 domain-containing protein n=1 Tax=Solihabitans fulvus TaxID=1892852 RepID=A0A5B2XFV3_9PSEU|nr:DUF397 domain-containing protein [Solihabitans fulvus]KAA2261771.1 DUF397 domain-containing protein [Solihabitans fulvus]
MPTADISGVRWRKSTRSNNGSDGCCVEVALVDASWRKSTSSNNGSDGACVEVAFGGSAAAFRDSKNPAGPVLLFPATALTGLVTALKRGRLDPDTV